MSKVAVVYWSGTGNTEEMANMIVDAVKGNGAGAEVFTPDGFSGEMVDEYSAIAFGCPSMGAEELEDSEFAPMFDEVETKLAGKKIALFGSYGWGDGEWMRNWEERCKAAGAVLSCDPVICCGAPDDEAADALKELGAALV